MRHLNTRASIARIALTGLLAGTIGACAGPDPEDVTFRQYCTAAATCPNGPAVRCSGYSGCIGQDGVGCQSYIATAFDDSGQATAGYIQVVCCDGSTNCTPGS